MRRCATCCPKPDADPGDLSIVRRRLLKPVCVLETSKVSRSWLRRDWWRQTQGRHVRQVSRLMCDIQKPLPHGTRGETCLDFVPWVCCCLPACLSSFLAVGDGELGARRRAHERKRRRSVWYPLRYYYILRFQRPFFTAPLRSNRVCEM